jgi:23S rRNA pseudouridine1911/1915/1917 synthase
MDETDIGFEEELPGDEPENQVADELYERLSIKVDRGQEPLRIDKFLMARIEGATRNKIQQAIDAGLVTVNGGPIKSNYKIKPADEIIFLSEDHPDQSEIVPEPMKIDYVYEDESVIVINKPAGIVVHPGSGNYSGTLVNGVAHHLMLQNPELTEFTLPRFGLVHRIDKNTSGLLLMAKNQRALNHLAKQFFNHTIERKYIALVWGDVEQDEGTIVAHVGRNPRYRKQFEAFPDGEHGKHAITHYKVLERFHYVTLVQCVLETGRTHQIRVHLQYIGHSIVGDEWYGDGSPLLLSGIKKNFKISIAAEEERPILSRLALHAAELSFEWKNQPVQLIAPLPKDMRATLQQLRKWAPASATITKKPR